MHDTVTITRDNTDVRMSDVPAPAAAWIAGESTATDLVVHVGTFELRARPVGSAYGEGVDADNGAWWTRADGETMIDVWERAITQTLKELAIY